MGKKRIVKTAGEAEGEKKASSVSSVSKKKVEVGILFVQSTYNNTKLVLTDSKGAVLGTSSSGSIGFKGAKKGTPFAAAKSYLSAIEKTNLVVTKTDIKGSVIFKKNKNSFIEIIRLMLILKGIQ